MSVNIAVFASVAGFFGCLRRSDLMSRVPSQGKLSPKSEVQIADKGLELDAYELAVLFSVAAATFSMCF